MMILLFPLIVTDNPCRLWPNGLLWNHGAGFAERAYGFRNREISVYNALQSRIGGIPIPSSVGTDLDGSVIPKDH